MIIVREFSEHEKQIIVDQYRSGWPKKYMMKFWKIRWISLSQVLDEFCVDHKTLRNLEKRYGRTHPWWTGGRSKDLQGYVRVRLERDDPWIGMAGKDHRVFEHRLVMGKYLGRLLESHETVHHINGRRDDNRIENLELRKGRHGNGIRMACGDCLSHNVSAIALASN